ncbi:hypothetical protein MF672_004210 [Actinomadura sp. ATCC 31491]|uniref:Uncharacterized protein n=1 Tax=Actinomadura luzonensis TaxID=2805427 RepID=A0ABT0FL02_9ACTN|nr:hypothetical protein [Actinomadura luzonensis]MCK2213002.1 hypothetical protein [Actinomadura luzonensis]
MNASRPWPTLVVASALTLVCAVAAGVAGSTAGAELTRGPTAAELRAAATREVAERWRAWPAGRVFPASLPYAAEQGGEERARRVGISPDTSCEHLDPSAAEALRRAGCRALLRATYIDALRGVLVTVGVAVLPDEPAAARARSAFPEGGEPVPGLRPLAFAGTVADRFTPAVRQTGSVRQAGPYLVLTTAGEVDGRPGGAVGEPRPTVFAFAAELAEEVLAALSTPVMPDCDGEEWRC